MAGDGADGSELELSDAGAAIGARDGETRTAAAEDDEDGGDDFGGGPLRRLAGGGGEASDEGARASEGTAHRPQREAEVWLEEGGRRMPSLAASSEAEAERAAKRVVVLRLDVERQRLMQKGLDEAAGEGHDDVAVCAQPPGACARRRRHGDRAARGDADRVECWPRR